MVEKNTNYFVVHENVNHLMPNDAPEPVQIPVGRNHYSAFQKLEEASHAIGNKAGCDIRLLEVEIGRVKNQRYPVIERKIESILELAVRLFREIRAMFRQIQHLRVVVDVEMIRFKNLPVEVLVLDLVVTEEIIILSVRRQNRRNEY